MATSGHSKAGLDSQSLCCSLCSELSKLIPNLVENATQGSCGIFQEGMTRFAYVYHSKNLAQIEIWCRGDREQLLENDPGLCLRARSNPKPGWETSFPARFRIHALEQVPMAAHFLAAYSYAATTSKVTGVPPNNSFKGMPLRGTP